MTDRTDYLDRQLDTLLGCMSPPARMPADSQVAEMQALGRAVDRLAPASGYEAWWLRFEDAVRALATTRAWPTCSDLERAAAKLRDDATAKNAAAAAGGDEPAYIYDFVAEWWGKFRSAGPGSLPKEHHAKRLVDAGLASWGELRRRGFPIPLWARDMAMAERDPKHDEIMEDIRIMGDRLRANGAPGGGLRPRHPIHSGLE